MFKILSQTLAEEELVAAKDKVEKLRLLVDATLADPYFSAGNGGEERPVTQAGRSHCHGIRRGARLKGAHYLILDTY